MWGAVIPICGDFVWGYLETLASMPEKQKSCRANHEMLACLAGLSESFIRTMLLRSYIRSYLKNSTSIFFATA